MISTSCITGTMSENKPIATICGSSEKLFTLGCSFLYSSYSGLEGNTCFITSSFIQSSEPSHPQLVWKGIKRQNKKILGNLTKKLLSESKIFKCKKL